MGNTPSPLGEPVPRRKGEGHPFRKLRGRGNSECSVCTPIHFSLRPGFLVFLLGALLSAQSWGQRSFQTQFKENSDGVSCIGWKKSKSPSLFISPLAQLLETLNLFLRETCHHSVCVQALSTCASDRSGRVVCDSFNLVVTI